ncbi:MAG: hypothetical protein KF830_00015 [Planctomycetes bacterium]|nr:hypothetical protein [Planctomycetota bacterium]
MTRLPALLSAAALLAAGAHAQCAQGPVANLVSWTSTSGFAATNPVNDEGLTATAVPLPFAFPMAGAIGTLDEMWVNSNGEIYLTDSTLALAQPVGGALFGVNAIAELRGGLNGSARIVALGGDHQGSAVSGANWSVNIDSSVSNQVIVSWIDMRRFGNATDRFSFRATLFSSGAVQFDYGPTFPVSGFTGRWVGISIGNDVGLATTPSSDLSAGPDSGTLGMLYQNFTGTAPNVWDLTGQSLTLTPNGLGGYTALPLVPFVAPTCASNQNYGAGCYTYTGPDTANLFQFFPDVPAAKAALETNVIQFGKNPNGYTATWLPGLAASLYVAPSLGAPIIANADDTTTTIVPSSPIPVPGGTAASWTVSSNGILTAAATGNQGTGFTPTLAATATATGLAWYVWADHNPVETGSGKVKWEEVGGVLYVTFDGVEMRGGTPTLAPSTFQFQVDMTTGDVTVVIVSFSVSNGTNDVLVGCTLAGAGPTPVSQDLATNLPFVLFPPLTLSPLSLSAAPRPTINPSTVVTYTATNLYEFIPTSGVYLSTMFLSVNPLPGGFDLGVIGAPGCNAYISTLDLDLGGQVTLAPTASWNFTYDNVGFAPGNVIAAQAICLFDPTFPLPNGQNAFGLTTSNGVLSTIEIY